MAVALQRSGSTAQRTYTQSNRDEDDESRDGDPRVGAPKKHPFVHSHEALGDGWMQADWPDAADRQRGPISCGMAAELSGICFTCREQQGRPVWAGVCLSIPFVSALHVPRLECVVGPGLHLTTSTYNYCVRCV